MKTQKTPPEDLRLSAAPGADPRGAQPGVSAMTGAGGALVFVYGTLLRGEKNSALLATAEFVGEARTTKGFRLYSCGAFPAMVHYVGGGRVVGEVWRVDARTLALLDRLEGVAWGLYQRKAIRVFIEGVSGYGAPAASLPLQAEAYLQDRDRQQGRVLIPGGSWRAR